MHIHFILMDVCTCAVILRSKCFQFVDFHSSRSIKHRNGVQNETIPLSRKKICFFPYFSFNSFYDLSIKNFTSKQNTLSSKRSVSFIVNSDSDQSSLYPFAHICSRHLPSHRSTMKENLFSTNMSKDLKKRRPKHLLVVIVVVVVLRSNRMAGKIPPLPHTRTRTLPDSLTSCEHTNQAAFFLFILFKHMSCHSSLMNDEEHQL